MEGVVGFLIYSQLVRSEGDNLEVVTGVGSGKKFCKTEPLTCGVCVNSE